MNLMIPLSPDAPIGRQIYERLRTAIVSGALEGGDRLPSTRDLAEQLGVSRTIVVLAFEQLLAEGYVEGRLGSGTFIAAGINIGTQPREQSSIARSRYGARIEALAGAAATAREPHPPPRFDFAYGRGNLDGFPFGQWRRMLSAQARKMPSSRLGYAEAPGDPALREAISDHVRRSRGVVCDADQVIVVSGSQQAIDLIARVMVDIGDIVAVEDPHYQGMRAILIAHGAELWPVPVDEHGIDATQLPTKAGLLFLTPSHQFPTGAVLPVSRRLAVLDWASKSGAVVVEDDYDGEFRYDGQPLESLQGLDADGRVIYVGTFSRTIYPALRIGYLVVPPSLTTVFSTAKWLTDRHSASLEQAVLAEFIGSGAYELYLRRLRRSLSAKREALLHAIEVAWGGTMRMTGATSGAHVALWPSGNFDESAAIRAAAANDVGVYPISPYCLGRGRRGLLLGYSLLSPDEIPEGISRLARTLSPEY